MDHKWVESIVSRTAAVPVRPQGAKREPAPDSKTNSFSAVLSNAVQATDRSAVTAPIKVSAHASQRLSQRGLQLNNTDLERLGQAIDKAQSKGARDAYVLYGDAGFVVSVPNRTVITAMSSREESIITNVDSVVVMQRPDHIGSHAMGTD